MKQTVVIEISGKKKEIKFPNNGELIALGNLRDSLSMGTYRESREDAGNLVLATYTFFYVMAPTLLDEHGLGGFDWNDRSYVETYEFVHTYESVILPWMKDVFAKLEETKKMLDVKLDKVEKAKEKLKSGKSGK